VKQIRGGHREEVFVNKLAAKGRLRLSQRGLEQPLIAQTVAATEHGELVGVNREHVIELEKLDRHLASFRSVSLCASISRAVDFRMRSFRGFLAGVMISDSPSVRTSSGVSCSMLSSSRIGRSMMNPKLLPMALSLRRTPNRDGCAASASR